MKIDRRGLLRLTLAAGGAVLASRPAGARAATGDPLSAGRWGMLVDTTLCVGCRHCEWACKRQHRLPSEPLARFADASVFERLRRPDAVSYTVVNRFTDPDNPGAPVYVKVQCMHCDQAACASACLVGALRKHENGPVLYDGSKCMGCRYCMVACPFQIPAYEYGNAFTPVVRKCTFCFEQVARDGDFPACCRICPQEVMTFGRRSDLLAAARERIKRDPGRYLPRIYGEHEVGGTDWLYLAGAPFEKLGLPSLGEQPVARLTESIQRGVFKFFLPPLALFALLGVLMWNSRDRPSRGSKPEKG